MSRLWCFMTTTTSSPTANSSNKQKGRAFIFFMYHILYILIQQYIIPTRERVIPAIEQRTCREREHIFFIFIFHFPYIFTVEAFPSVGQRDTSSTVATRISGYHRTATVAQTPSLRSSRRNRAPQPQSCNSGPGSNATPQARQRSRAALSA